MSKFVEMLLNADDPFLSAGTRELLFSNSLPAVPCPKDCSVSYLGPALNAHGLMSNQQDRIAFYPYDLTTVMLHGIWGYTLDLLFLVPSRKFALIMFATDVASLFSPELLRTALHTLLDVTPVPESTIQEDAAALEKYVGTYGVQSLTAKVELQGDHLHLNAGAESCDLVPSYPPNFFCPGAHWGGGGGLSFGFGANDQVQYLQTAAWTATRVPDAADAGSD
jgi:hypothetical protein